MLTLLTSGHEYLKDPLFPLWLLLGISGGTFIILGISYLLIKNFQKEKKGIYKYFSEKSEKDQKIQIQPINKILEKNILKAEKSIFNLEKQLKEKINNLKNEIINDSSISDFDQRRFNLILEELKDIISIEIDFNIRKIENLLNERD